MKVGTFNQTALTGTGRGRICDIADLGEKGGSYEVNVGTIGTNVTFRVEYSSSSSFASDVVKGGPVTVTATGIVVLPVLPIRQYFALMVDSNTGAFSLTGVAKIFE